MNQPMSLSEHRAFLQSGNDLVTQMAYSDRLQDGDNEDGSKLVKLIEPLRQLAGTIAEHEFRLEDVTKKMPQYLRFIWPRYNLAIDWEGPQRIRLRWEFPRDIDYDDDGEHFVNLFLNLRTLWGAIVHTEYGNEDIHMAYDYWSVHRQDEYYEDEDDPNDEFLISEIELPLVCLPAFVLCLERVMESDWSDLTLDPETPEAEEARETLLTKWGVPPAPEPAEADNYP